MYEELVRDSGPSWLLIAGMHMQPLQVEWSSLARCTIQWIASQPTLPDVHGTMQKREQQTNACNSTCVPLPLPQPLLMHACHCKVGLPAAVPLRLPLAGSTPVPLPRLLCRCAAIVLPVPVSHMNSDEPIRARCCLLDPWVKLELQSLHVCSLAVLPLGGPYQRGCMF